MCPRDGHFLLLSPLLPGSGSPLTRVESVNWRQLTKTWVSQSERASVISEGLMGDSSKISALGTARTIFEALAPHLVARGITSSEAENLLRAVCVHEAARSFLDHGRRPNVSQISIKTGVDRHVVAEILKTPPRVDRALGTRRDATSRVIAGWLSDSRYLRNGQPLALPVGDPRTRGRTVWSLVEDHAPGVWPRLVIDELIRIDLVEALPDGTLRCVHKPHSERVEPAGTMDESSGQLIRDAIHSHLQDMKSGRRRSWRSAQSVQITRDKVPLVRKMVRDRLDSVVSELADELASPRWKPSKTDIGRKTLIGISAFSFEHVLSPSREAAKTKNVRARKGQRKARKLPT